MRGALVAALCLGVVGAAVGMGLYALLADSALQRLQPGDGRFADGGAARSRSPGGSSRPIPLARERYEAYALLTVTGPVCVLLLCPALALAAGKTGAVIGFAAGWVLGGVIAAPGRFGTRGAPRLPRARSTACARPAGSAPAPG